MSEAVDAELFWSDDGRATLLAAIAALGERRPIQRAADQIAACRDLDLARADGSDQMAAIAAVHALAAFPGVGPGERLAALLYQERSFLREHAAWALGSRSPVTAALPGLVDLVLDRWLRRQPGPGHAGVVRRPGPRAGARCAGRCPAVRRRSRVRAVGWSRRSGWFPGRSPRAYCSSCAADDRELPAARAAALAALGDDADPCDPQVHAVLDAVACSDGLLAGVAGLARSDLEHRRSTAGRSGPTRGADRRPALPARRHRRRPAPRRSGRHRRHRDPPGAPGRRAPRRPRACAAGGHDLAWPGRRRPGSGRRSTAPVTTTCPFPSGGRRCPPRRRGPCASPPGGRCGASSTGLRSTCCTCAWPTSGRGPRPRRPVTLACPWC